MLLLMSSTISIALLMIQNRSPGGYCFVVGNEYDSHSRWVIHIELLNSIIARDNRTTWKVQPIKNLCYSHLCCLWIESDCEGWPWYEEIIWKSVIAHYFQWCIKGRQIPGRHSSWLLIFKYRHPRNTICCSSSC